MARIGKRLTLSKLEKIGESDRKRLNELAERLSLAKKEAQNADILWTAFILELEERYSLVQGDRINTDSGEITRKA